MSRKNVPIPIDRTEMRVFLVRQGMTDVDFCSKHNLNLGTFRSWICGADHMPMFSQRVLEIVKGYNYNFELLINPDLRLQLEAVGA
jgi:hypothetical protein